MAAGPYSGGQLEVMADLTVTVDGMTSTVSGVGSQIRLESPDPARLLDALAQAELPARVGRVDGPRFLGRLADQLNELGLTVTVSGPQGDVLALGDVAGSWSGRLLTGSRRVRPGSWAAVRPLAQAAALRRRGRLAAGLAAVVLAVVVGRRARATDS